MRDNSASSRTAKTLVSLTLMAIILGSVLTPISIATAQEELSVSIDVSKEATVDEKVSISVPVSIPDVIGDHESEISLALYVNGEEVTTKEITVEDGSETTATFSHTFESAGTHDVKISGEVTLGGQTFSKGASTTIEVSAPTTDDKTGSQTITGAVFPVPESLQDEVDSYREQLPLDNGLNAFILATEKDLFIVFTEKEPQEGIATVQGRTFSPELSANGLSFSAVRAQSVSFKTTGTESTVGDVNANPSEYQLELVRIQATHRQVSTLTDPDQGEDITGVTSAGVLVENPSTASSLMTKPAQKARSLSVNSSTDKLTSNTQNELDELIGTNQPRLYTFDFSTTYWSDTETTVDGIVLTPDSKARDFLSTFDTPGVLEDTLGSPLLYVVESESQSQSYDSVNTIKQRADDGDVVTVETNLYGKSISIQETLEHNTPCTQTKAQIPTPSGPICVDLIQDNLVQTGVAWGSIPESQDDVLFVVGVSSGHSDNQTDPIQGQYRITGEIISTSRVAESLPNGRILMVYDMERIGGIKFEEIAKESRSLLENRSELLTDHLQSQVSGENIKPNASDGTHQVLTRLSANEYSDVQFNQTGRETLELKKVSLKPSRSLENVDVRAKPVDSLPNDVTQPPSQQFGVFNISVSASDEDIQNADIEFVIPKSKLQDGASPAVYRYHAGSWNALQTTNVSQTTDEVVIRAKSPGFSYFAIGKRSDGTTTQDRKEAQTTTDSKSTTKGQSEETRTTEKKQSDCSDNARASLTIETQIGKGKKITITRAKANVDYIVLVRSESQVIGRTGTIQANKLFSDKIAVNPHLSLHDRYSVGVYCADGEAEINSLNNMLYHIEGKYPKSGSSVSSIPGFDLLTSLIVIIVGLQLAGRLRDRD